MYSPYKTSESTYSYDPYQIENSTTAGYKVPVNNTNNSTMG